MIKRKHLLAVGLVAALGMSAAACGDDDDSDADRDVGGRHGRAGRDHRAGRDDRRHEAPADTTEATEAPADTAEETDETTGGTETTAGGDDAGGSAFVTLEDECATVRGPAGSRRLPRQPRHRHRQGRRRHVQPVRLRGHDRRQRVLRHRGHRASSRRCPRPTTRPTSPRRWRASPTCWSPSASCSTDDTEAAATANPDVDFIGIDQFLPEYPANMAGVQFNEDESGYIAGVLAASLSETGVIGVVAGLEDVPPVVKFVNGYTVGARVREPRHPGAVDLQRQLHRRRPRARPTPPSSSARAPT